MKFLFFSLYQFIVIGIISISSLFSLYANDIQKVDTSTIALLIIDIQNFYFPGGVAEIEEPEKAIVNAKKILNTFRVNNQLIIHIRHNYEPGGEIHADVKPTDNEKVISKDHANSFIETDLFDYLKANGVERLVICGMMTHMCVEATTRAAHDYGFECVVISDACATKSLEFEEEKINAKDVHYSSLATLSSGYADIMTTEFFIANFF